VRAALLYNRGDCRAIRGERRGVGSCVGIVFGGSVVAVGGCVGSTAGVGVGILLCTWMGAVLLGGMLARVWRPWIRGRARNAFGAVGVVDVVWWVCCPPFVPVLSSPFVAAWVGHGRLSRIPSGEIVFVANALIVW
jgi:hypothetical protein